MALALIVAAGSGERLGADRPKALVELAGRPLLQYSLEALSRVELLERIVVALPAGVAAPAGVVAVEGGAVRSASVKRALAAAVEGKSEGTGESDLVLVHDAARPLLTPELAREVLEALSTDPRADAAIAAVPVTDTIKRVADGRVVAETLDRRSLWAVQTPQVFRRGALERALDVSEEVLAQATDDAWLIERAGGRVIVVPSSDENIKVTTARDLRTAELLLERRASSEGDPA
ncbi:MAG: 2-C-methyl-D-erythritol 4-phosphate cytidylyltransferase [Actinobacteria bacterium]|nr:MAG: 2-C-methyl-D-erythritol 4-phosphate cytidylyltransferase [Actinomycetota bacterium]